MNLDWCITHNFHIKLTAYILHIETKIQYVHYYYIGIFEQYSGRKVLKISLKYVRLYMNLLKVIFLVF